MLDRLKSFLTGLPADESESRDFGPDDPRLAASAILAHIIEADGVVKDEERSRLHDILRQAYDLDDETADRLVRAGEKAENEAVDLYAFTRVLKRALSEEERIDFVALMWELVYADHEIHELEDNMVWRVAELLGVSSRDRVMLRRQTASAMAVAPEPDTN